MNKGRVSELCAELASGKYEQGRGFLRKRTTPEPTYRYCCLGVGCVVYAHLAGDGEWHRDEIFELSNGDSGSQFMPKKVRDWFGFTDFQARYLIEMNDQLGKSFLEIATWLRGELANAEVRANQLLPG